MGVIKWLRSRFSTRHSRQTKRGAPSRDEAKLPYDRMNDEQRAAVVREVGSNLTETLSRMMGTTAPALRPSLSGQEGPFVELAIQIVSMAAMNKWSMTKLDAADAMIQTGLLPAPVIRRASGLAESMRPRGAPSGTFPSDTGAALSSGAERQVARLAFLLVCNHEEPALVLQAVKQVNELRAALVRESAQPGQCKILLCHGEVVCSLPDVTGQPEWDSLLQFCSDNAITVGVDPKGTLRSRSITNLFSFALALSAPFDPQVLVALSADARASADITVYGVTHALRSVLRSTEMRLGVDVDQSILMIPSSARDAIELPGMLLDDQWQDLVNWVWRKAAMSAPSAVVKFRLSTAG